MYYNVRKRTPLWKKSPTIVDGSIYEKMRYSETNTSRKILLTLFLGGASIFIAAHLFSVFSRLKIKKSFS